MTGIIKYENQEENLERFPVLVMLLRDHVSSVFSVFLFFLKKYRFTFINFPVQINPWYGLFGKLIDRVFVCGTSGDNTEEITQAEINESVYTSLNCVNSSFSCYFCELCVYSAVLFLEDLNPLKQPFPTEVSNITDSKDFDKQLSE